MSPSAAAPAAGAVRFSPARSRPDGHLVADVEERPAGLFEGSSFLTFLGSPSHTSRRSAGVVQADEALRLHVAAAEVQLQRAVASAYACMSSCRDARRGLSV
jgi:hypothetical protein